MYSALCPKCGAAMYNAAGGSLLVSCVRCPWTGQATFHYLPTGSQPTSGNGGNGGSSPHGGAGGVGGIWSHIQFPQLPPFTMTMLPGPDEAPAEEEPDPLAARRAATGKRLYALASTVAELVQTVDTEDWQMPAWRRYERLQRAHEALYTALGGVRMGDYRPTQAKLDEAVADVLLWALLTLDAVER